ncbi:unnamed protein product [Rhizophagus irregularis]|uniref:Protection of telomeres protein 1 n=1 Tax=Rhizophagus irregularis TaxID=588596 RepID=A0A2I1FY39_9GLOM|nr:hypothetical protein RhiirA4_212163 [Rhizophagus irregularis]CAB4405636.1 unnamed protein product [Rhizophagus irregularis]CAB4406078.1 unnamed protein product [Rhizophagus irregularis]
MSSVSSLDSESGQHSDEEVPETLTDENVNVSLTSEHSPVNGFILLQKARLPGALVNVVGVVVSYTPNRKSSGTDYTCSLTLVDPSIPNNVKGISVNIFRSRKEHLPDLSVGSIFIGKHLRINTFHETTQLVATKEESTFKVICDVANQNQQFPFNMRQHAKEIMAYANYLRRWCASLSNSKVGNYTSITSSRQRRRIEELSPHIFFDLIAEVVMVYPTENAVDLYVTDFTENKLLGNREYRTNTPYGLSNESILQITLWDEHAEDGEDLQIGTFVLLQNLHAKINTNGDLVAALHGDRELRRKKINVLDKNDVEIAKLIRRRNAYYEEHQNSLEYHERDSSPELESDTTEQSITRIKCNNNIKLTDIDDIKDCPEPVGLFRTRGRVISVIPSNFEDFSRPYCHRCNKIMNFAEYENCTQCFKKLKVFKYDFGLLFEDELGAGTLPVLITNEDANTFLDGLPPVNLYKNPMVLQKLKDRMHKLLGNVLKSQASCGPLIDFCVMSYEVEDECNKFIRIYKMFDTILED